MEYIVFFIEIPLVLFAVIGLPMFVVNEFYKENNKKRKERQSKDTTDNDN